MTPETNHDVDISIYYDFLEDQGLIVDREEEEQDQWGHEVKDYIFLVGGGNFDGVGGNAGTALVGGRGGRNIGSVNGCNIGYESITISVSERIGG